MPRPAPCPRWRRCGLLPGVIECFNDGGQHGKQLLGGDVEHAGRLGLEQSQLVAEVAGGLGGVRTHDIAGGFSLVAKFLQTFLAQVQDGDQPWPHAVAE